MDVDTSVLAEPEPEPEAEPEPLSTDPAIDQPDTTVGSLLVEEGLTTEEAQSPSIPPQMKYH
jgi:hypothetical protein